VTSATQTALTLRVARGQQEQQAAIDAWLGGRALDGANKRLGIIAEGAFFELKVPPAVPLERLAAGCVCCVGMLPLQVALARMLRSFRPQSVLLLMTDPDHLDRMRILVTSGKLGVVLENSTEQR
jgi:hypothetical protein